MTAYNQRGLLPDTLDAILAQSVMPHEVVLVDDGSTDDTGRMVEDRYGQHVRLMRVANGGDLAARNAGLARVTGDLVAFCDSDHLWQPDFLAHMAALWRAEPRIGAAFADFRLLRDDAPAAGTKFDDAPAGFWSGLRAVGPGLAVFDATVVERVIGFQPFLPSCMVVERSFFVGLGGWDVSVGRMVGADLATILLLAEQAPFGVVRKPLVAIRKHDGDQSSDVQAMHLRDAAILEHVLARRPSMAELRPVIEASMARRRAEALDLAFARGDHTAVMNIWRQLPKAVRAWPRWAKAQSAALPSALRKPVVRGLLALGAWRESVGRTGG
ncbi:MAG: glycosyltransferase [Rubritepida sp.]|nr:glycosyltransferase [Rubritepida sp.]